MRKITLDGAIAKAVSAFLAEHGKAEILVGDDRITVISYDTVGYDSITINGDGIAEAEIYWGSSEFFDRWILTDDGEISYKGTVDGYRRPPKWLGVE